MRITVADLI